MERPPPLVIGHAAAAGEAPANTLAGVRACLAARAEAMEIDVQLSADGVPVLMHDTTVDRTTNLRGPVRELTVAQLQAADAGDGEPVPSLDAVLELVAGQLAVFSELKATPGEEEQDRRLVEAVLGCYERHAAEAWAGIHSFSPAIVAAARARRPGVSAALISPDVEGDTRERLFARALQSGAQAVSVHYTSVTPGLVAAARRRQLCVWAWTPDGEEAWTALAAAGADGIITNLPGSLRRFLGG